jgi:hypothetical protein
MIRSALVRREALRDVNLGRILDQRQAQVFSPAFEKAQQQRRRERRLARILLADNQDAPAFSERLQECRSIVVTEIEGAQGKRLGRDPAEGQVRAAGDRRNQDRDAPAAPEDDERRTRQARRDSVERLFEERRDISRDGAVGRVVDLPSVVGVTAPDVTAGLEVDVRGVGQAEDVRDVHQVMLDLGSVVFGDLRHLSDPQQP